MPKFHLQAPRLALACALLAAGTAHAFDFSTINLLSQGEFRELSGDVAAVSSYKPLAPAEATGLAGFDVGLSASGTGLQHRDVWRKVTVNGDVPGTLPVVGLRAQKGLPLNIDVGLSYSMVPTTSVRASGGELRWAVLPGSALTPAIAIRLSASSLSGVDQLKLRTTGADVSISKGFVFATPYAGIGRVQVRSSAPGAPAIQDEKFSLNKIFVGANIPLGLLFNLNIEADKTGAATSIGAKFGLRF